MIETGASMRVQSVIVGKVNFASAQNDVAVVRKLSVENAGGEAVRNVRLTLTADPPIIRDKTWIIDSIAPGTTIALTDLKTPLDLTLLAGLNEAEIGTLTLTLASDEVEPVTEVHRIEMLARDEWGGLAEMDNILAAFVSPNHPVVARLLKEAAGLLEAAGHSGAIDGYQSNDPQRVWMLSGAIWSAATGLGLTYAVPPASFERIGQKVRSPERIASDGLATCLDTTLLLAAAFEAAGLNTAVLFSQGHAWVGVWLVPKNFASLVQPDVVAVRKAATSSEFVPLETTLLTRRPPVGFEEAVAAGRDRLSEAREAEFQQAIDINLARAARIRPLAMHRSAEAPAEEGDGPSAPAALPRALDLGMLPGEVVEAVPTTAIGRIERWQRKLLDLSLRNRLLNFVDAKTSLPMICPDISAIEDRLANGAVFDLLALKDENALINRDLTPEEARRIEFGLAADAMKRGQIAVPLTKNDMTLRLTELYRKAQSDMAEGGTNTLFLAVGFLRWKRSEKDPRSHRAPLLLLPVKLERRSARSTYRLSQLEDEVRINSTLLEMLKRDFELCIPELEGELPSDGSGLDIKRILEVARQRVRDVPGFEVVEECAFSTFSFAKYLMWKDLVDRTASLRESRLVAHLVDNPTDVFEQARTPMPRPEDIDGKHAPADLLAPLPADSSQLAAVMAAAEGRDFVLIGPPGTGKSQTITNIIADQLGRGRTVLFVAEKAAALDVVHRRLERHGLADAVLELHSSKADRKKVLSQLRRSWDRASAAKPADWVTVSEDLRLTRNELNAYVTALHRPGTQGFSVFEAIGKMVDRAPSFDLKFAGKDCHDGAAYQRLRSLARTLGERHRIVADLDPEGPLSLLDSGEWSYAWQADYMAAAQALRLARGACADARARLLGQLGVPDADDAALSLLTDRLDQPAALTEACQNPTGARLSLPLFQDALSRARDARSRMQATYRDASLADMPLDQLELGWVEAAGKSWPFAGFAKNKLCKVLQGYAVGGQADPATDLPALRQLLRARGEIETSPLRTLPGFAGEDSDTTLIGATIASAEAYLEWEANLRAKGLATSVLDQHRAQLARASAGEFAPLLSAYRAANEQLARALALFRGLGGELPAGREALLGGLDAQQARFGDWLKWRAIRAEAAAAGLQPLVTALEEGRGVEDATEAFERAYMGWWLRLALDADACLRGFAYWEHDARIKRFGMLDDAQAGLAAPEVMRRLGNDLPIRDLVPRRSELGVLRHQLGLQRPSLAIRSLIGEMPTSFAKLAPCVLMSPLSVAQYLPPGKSQFDLVIFDEASQISTWDAIGAIARGRQAIIVGDPQQLPPTNFFGRADDSAEGEFLAEVENDMPSILDEVGAAGIPTHRLDWHYRSRDESLIAFSNRQYYDDELVTFPSPNGIESAVRFHAVRGVYERGTAKTNPAEARAVAAFVKDRLIQWLKVPEGERQTLGVITFNAQQQGLILDLLDAERKADPRLEWFFADEREEPVIVKNLENIQGDERDVILFSVTFGPDRAGKITMNFGPMNQDGGHKRLNVAVTRARAEMHVFASITNDQIDLTRTQARGVADLKAFLDYAQRGPVALAARDTGSLGPVESPFEDAVRAALSARGWDVRPQIGVSGFRIDLGIRHPDHAGAWLAGIECDGAQYHRSATARDRDRIRQAVLEGLGWTILRIWSTDWFRARETALTRIDTALRALLEADRTEREAKLAALTKEAEASGKVICEDDGDQARVTETPGPANVPDAPVPSETDEIIQPLLVAQNVSRPQGPGTDVTPDGNRFFDADYTDMLQRIMEQIVLEEGPLPDEALARAVARRHGWQRSGSRIQAKVRKLSVMFDTTDEDGVRFLWPKGQVAQLAPFRGTGDRSLRDISRSEIASVIDRHWRRITDADDPDLEIARLMGVSRLSKDARHYLSTCRQWYADNH